ncbi:phospholipase D family protein [Candidatus Micrarchaeota archaeon]|nr:phospholipase D family protein [Candidatus Micrarchaeota archaeon]
MKRGMIFAGGLLLGILVTYIGTLFFIVPVNTVFSPDDGREIIDLIDSAEDSIDIEMYVFTSRDVVEALERAKNKGVEIRIIVERSTISGSNKEIFNELSAKGFRVKYASTAFQLTHSKFMILDGKVVFVGSHNFSNSALYKNREASVIIYSEKTAGEFQETFNYDWSLAS